MSDHEDEAQALRAVELERMDAAWIRPDPEADAAVDELLLQGAARRRERREERLRAQGFEQAEAMRRKIELNEAIARPSLEDAAHGLLDAVVWRYDGPDGTASVDLRGVTVELLRDLARALIP